MILVDCNYRTPLGNVPEIVRHEEFETLADAAWWVADMIADSNGYATIDNFRVSTQLSKEQHDDFKVAFDARERAIKNSLELQQLRIVRADIEKRIQALRDEYFEAGARIAAIETSMFGDA